MQFLWLGLPRPLNANPCHADSHVEECKTPSPFCRAQDAILAAESSKSRRRALAKGLPLRPSLSSSEGGRLRGLRGWEGCRPSSVQAQVNPVWGRDAFLEQFPRTGLATTQQTLRADVLHMWVARKRCTQGALMTGSTNSVAGVAVTDTGWPLTQFSRGLSSPHSHELTTQPCCRSEPLSAGFKPLNRPPTKLCSHPNCPPTLQLCQCSPSKVRGVQTCCTAGRCADCMQFARSRARQRTPCIKQPHQRPEGLPSIEQT